MEHAQEVRARLDNLKKLSVSLKQETRDLVESRHDAVKAIIEIAMNRSMTKQTNISDSISGSVYQWQSSKCIDSPSNKSTSLFKTFSSTFLTKKESNYASSGNNIDLCCSDVSLLKKLPSSPTSRGKLPHLHSMTVQEQEIMNLQVENMRVEMELRDAREELENLRNQCRAKEQLNTKNTQIAKDSNQDSAWGQGKCPFFQLSERLMCFVTRINIPRHDYDKMEHHLSQVHLTLGNMSVSKLYAPKLISKLSLGSQSDASKPKPASYSLADLKSVSYLEDNQMMAIFCGADSTGDVNVYLKFQDQQSLHRWDLGLYINYTISKSLNTSNLFAKEFPSSSQKKASPQIQDSEPSSNTENTMKFEPELAQEKEAFVEFLRHKQQYIASQRKLKEIMLSKLARSRARQNIDVSFNPNANIVKDVEQKQSKTQEINSYGIQKTIQKQKNLVRLNPQFQSQNTKTKVQTKFNIEQKQPKEDTTVKQISVKMPNTKEKYEAAIEMLQKGIYMTKYSKSGFSPHEKRVFISDDAKKFCWQDKDSKDSDYKCVLVSDIVKFDKESIGAGIDKHVGKKNIKNYANFIVIHTKNKDKKVLEFGIKNLKLMQVFTDNFEIFLTHSKANDDL